VKRNIYNNQTGQNKWPAYNILIAVVILTKHIIKNKIAGEQKCIKVLAGRGARRERRDGRPVQISKPC
jgi:hypothetical protein